MHERILRQMRARIRLRQYVMTLHAEDEMNDDQLTIFDIERAISIGEIVERQRIEMVQQGESYLTADTLHELERIKQHRQLLAKQRPVPVAVFA